MLDIILIGLVLGGIFGGVFTINKALKGYTIKNKEKEEKNLGGFEMKQFTGLSYDEGMYKLEIYCYALEGGKVDSLIPLLEEKGFILTNIDADSLSGEIIKEQYPDIVKVRKELSEEGFTWSKNAKRIKLPA